MRASPIFSPVRRCRSLLQSNVDHWSNRTSTILSTPQHKHRVERIKDFGVSSERHEHLNVLIIVCQGSCNRQPRIVMRSMSNVNKMFVKRMDFVFLLVF